MRVLCLTFLELLLLAPADAAAPPKPTLLDIVPEIYRTAERKYQRAILRIPSDRYPITTRRDGQWKTTDASGWTSGFFPGSLWLLYERTREPRWRRAALKWQKALTPQQNNVTTHDIGFMMFSSFGNGERLTGDETFRAVLRRAARSLASRAHPPSRVIRSWNTDSRNVTVIIDSLMNLELLFWAARNGGDPALRGLAVRHAERVARDFTRPDGSTFHVVTYDAQTGKRLGRTTAQGRAAESTWTRGQAWAIAGFALTYRETKDPAMLGYARTVADYFLSQIRKDAVPPWDFSVRGVRGEPQDSSAAAIAAAGLLELSRLETDRARGATYKSSAERILRVLATRYLDTSEATEALLKHGTTNRRIGDMDTGTSWGDYYFLEAIRRWQSGESSSLVRQPKNHK